MTEPFDWQTEEEGDWPEENRTGPSVGPVRRWRRSLLIFIPLILVVVGGVYWQAQQRVEQAKSARENDILSSLRLIREAAELKDVEVLTVLLSGADLNWARTQQDLAEKGWLYDRDAFGLIRVPGSLDVVDFAFSPELNSVELTTEEDYLQVNGAESDQTVTLRHVDVFRAGGRWLWAPPKNEFWGGTASGRTAAEYITLFYPQRDKEVSMKLLEDFDAMVDDLCQQSGLCPGGMRIQIRFSQDPTNLLLVSAYFLQDGYYGELIHLPDGRLSFTLPTPSLVGTPVDDLSYQAILRGYGRLIAGALLDDFLEHDCCGSMNMRRAVIRSTLQQVGLWPWTIVSNSSSLPASEPDYDLVTLCAGTFGSGASLWYYDTVRHSWRSMLAGQPIRSMQPIPGGGGAALLEVTAENDLYRARIYIWQDGNQRDLFDQLLTSDELDNFRWQVRERENRLLVEIPNVRIGISDLTVFDLNQCDESGCKVDEFQAVSLPTWSPDGSQRLAHQQGMIWRNQGIFSVPIGQGERPFWINDTSFGYLNQIGEETAVAYKVRSGAKAEIVLTTEDLKNELPGESTSQKVVIGHIAVDPQHPDTWIILAFNIGQEGKTEEALVFQYDLTERTLDLLEYSQNLRSFDLSSNGSRLATNRYVDHEQRWLLAIYSLRKEFESPLTLSSGQITASPPWYGWSPDGQWLSVLDNGELTLYHPAEQLEYSFNTPAPGCTQSSWLSRS